MKSIVLPLTLTVRNKSRISYTVGIHFTDSQFHNGILSCPFLMEQSDLSQERRKLPKAGCTSSNVVVQSAPPVDIGLNDLPNLGWAIARSAQPSPTSLSLPVTSHSSIPKHSNTLG